VQLHELKLLLETVFPAMSPEASGSAIDPGPRSPARKTDSTVNGSDSFEGDTHPAFSEHLQPVQLFVQDTDEWTPDSPSLQQP
jgi:hypothetical protein